MQFCLPYGRASVSSYTLYDCVIEKFTQYQHLASCLLRTKCTYQRYPRVTLSGLYGLKGLLAAVLAALCWICSIYFI